MHVSVLGGYEGTIAAVDADGAQLALGSGGRLRVRWGEEVTVTGRPMRLVRPGGDATDDGRSAERFTRLRDWRRERAKTDGVPAFVVLNDRYLDGIATANPRTLEELMRCDGIGPVKLELYGDDILDVLASV